MSINLISSGSLFHPQYVQITNVLCSGKGLCHDVCSLVISSHKFHIYLLVLNELPGVVVKHINVLGLGSGSPVLMAQTCQLLTLFTYAYLRWSQIMLLVSEIDCLSYQPCGVGRIEHS